ncbi:MAG TPA: MFS transporter [Bacillales bacterium]|nr:MFS transporter [Bacillales bacterium]
MNRWMGLTGFALLVFSSQILWVTFSPITTDVAEDMHTSVGNIGNLAALFPIVYIFVALPAGKWLDSHFKGAIAFGAICTGVGGAARLIAPFSFPWELAVQTFLAVGQPFVVNAVAAYARRYFPERERPIAISVASVALFVGVIFAMVLSPILYAAGGLSLVVSVFAIPCVLSMLWVLAGLRAPMQEEEAVTAQATGLTSIWRDKFLWLLCGLLSVGLGVFDALNTWLEPIFAQYGIGGFSGPLLALMLVAGIIGSMVLPSWAASRGLERRVLMVAVTLTAGTFAAIIAWQWIPWIAAWMVVDGFFLLAGFPIIMEWTEKHVGPRQQGIAVGLLMLTSHVGGIILIYAVQFLLSPPYAGLGVLLLANVIGILLVMRLPRSSRKFDLPVGVGEDRSV